MGIRWINHGYQVGITGKPAEFPENVDFDHMFLVCSLRLPDAVAKFAQTTSKPTAFPILRQLLPDGTGHTNADRRSFSQHIPGDDTEFPMGSPCYPGLRAAPQTGRRKHICSAPDSRGDAPASQAPRIPVKKASTGLSKKLPQACQKKSPQARS